MWNIWGAITGNGGTLTLTGSSNGQLGNSTPGPGGQMFGGSGGLVKSGPGTWTLNAYMANTGPYTISAGTLILNNHWATNYTTGLYITGGSVNVATVQYYGGTTNAISGGTLNLATAELYSGGGGSQVTTVSGGGTIIVGGWGNNATAGLGHSLNFGPNRLVVNNGAITYTGGYDGGTDNRGFTIGAGGATLDAEGGANVGRLPRATESPAAATAH